MQVGRLQVQNVSKFVPRRNRCPEGYPKVRCARAFFRGKRRSKRAQSVRTVLSSATTRGVMPPRASRKSRLELLSDAADAASQTAERLVAKTAELAGKVHLRAIRPETAAFHERVIDYCLTYLERIDKGAGSRMAETGAVDERLNGACLASNRTTAAWPLIRTAALLDRDRQPEGGLTSSCIDHETDLKIKDARRDGRAGLAVHRHIRRICTPVGSEWPIMSVRVELTPTTDSSAALGRGRTTTASPHRRLRRNSPR